MKSSDFLYICSDDISYVFVTHEDSGTGRGINIAYRVPKDSSFGISKLTIPTKMPWEYSTVKFSEIPSERRKELMQYLCNHSFVEVKIKSYSAITRYMCKHCKLRKIGE